MDQGFYNQLIKVVDKDNGHIDEPMSKHTTFRIGGPADYFVAPADIKGVQAVIGLCKEQQMPYYILGNGSNLLVADKGYRGVIIQIYKQMNRVTIENNLVKVQAGALLSRVANLVYEEGLSGFEFASGIPGTIGGAVVMNAGAYGGEMKDVVKSAVVLTDENEVATLENDELELGYRTSIIAKKGYTVLQVNLELQPGNKAEIKKRLEELREQRNLKQPLDWPSAGSTFKRPEGYFAGKLIQDAGLRGFQVGDAQVSEKHSGFVINKGSATAEEVAGLISQVSEQVYGQFGVRLEPEVKRIGEF